MSDTLSPKENKITDFVWIFFIWTVSVFISRSTLFRPLGGTPHEWLTGHTLISMRAFEEWGFFRLMGASIFVPHSPEFLGIELTRFAKVQGTYLSYPSFWVILPYVVFKVLKFLHIITSLSPIFVYFYNLILQRLLCGALVFYIYMEMIQLISGGKFAYGLRRQIAITGLIGWMLAPPSLYWTQNIYFADQAVLVFVYALFLFSLKKRFDFSRLSRKENALLFGLSFLSCGIDYYAWIFMAFISLVAWDSSGRIPLKDLVYRMRWLFLGAFLAALFYLSQLIYFEDGLAQLVRIFFHRTLELTDDQSITITHWIILSRAIRYWINYIPHLYLVSRVFLKPFVSIEVLSLTILFSFLAGFFVFNRKHKPSKDLYHAYFLLFLAPLFQIFVLKQHSYVHAFSAYKLGIAVSFGLLVFPITALALFLCGNARAVGPEKYEGSLLLVFVMAAFSVTALFLSQPLFQQYAKQGNLINKNYGEIVKKYVGDDEILMADPPPSERRYRFMFPYSLRVKPFSRPEPLWYTNRFVYAPLDIWRFRREGKFNEENFKKMKFAFISYTSETSRSIADEYCRDQWVPLDITIDHREVAICRSQELKHLLDPDILRRNLAEAKIAS